MSPSAKDSQRPKLRYLVVQPGLVTNALEHRIVPRGVKGLLVIEKPIAVMEMLVWEHYFGVHDRSDPDTLADGTGRPLGGRSATTAGV